MKFGLIGAGCIGQIRAKALRRIKGCELTAVTDVDKTRAYEAATMHGAKVFDNYEQMLPAEDIDAVIVSTPPQFHEEIVISSLEAGKHVHCEKPLANSQDASRRMVQVSRKTGKILTTGFNQRYFPIIQFVKHVIDTNTIGELDHIRAFAGHKGISEFRSPWEYDKNVIGGGALMDIGIHIIDITRYLLGEIEEVYGIYSTNIWNLKETEDNGYALMRNPQGKIAILHATWSEWKGYRFNIEAYGTSGMVRAYYAPMMNMVILFDKTSGRRKRKFNCYIKNNIQEKLYGWQFTVEKTFQKELSDFVNLCQGNKINTIADGFSGFRAIEIANAIYSSNLEKKTIRLNQPF